MGNSKEGAKKAMKTNYAKYGGRAGYVEEMKRRRALVKKPGFASMSSEAAQAAAYRSWEVRRQNAKAKE